MRVTLVSSDGHEFSLDEPEWRKLGTVEKLVADAGTEEPIPIPGVEGSALRQVIGFLQGKESVQDWAGVLEAADYLEYEELVFTLMDRLKKSHDAMHVRFKRFIPLLYYSFENQTHAIIFAGRWKITNQFTKGDNHWAFVDACGRLNIDLIVFRFLHFLHKIPYDAIEYAARYGRVNVVEYLVACGFSPYTNRYRAIRQAATASSADIVKFFWDKAPDALEVAILDGDIEACRFLIEMGVRHPDLSPALRMADATTVEALLPLLHP